MSSYSREILNTDTIFWNLKWDCHGLSCDCSFCSFNLFCCWCYFLLIWACISIWRNVHWIASPLRDRFLVKDFGNYLTSWFPKRLYQKDICMIRKTKTRNSNDVILGFELMPKNSVVIRTQLAANAIISKRGRGWFEF